MRVSFFCLNTGSGLQEKIFFAFFFSTWDFAFDFLSLKILSTWEDQKPIANLLVLKCFAKETFLF